MEQKIDIPDERFVFDRIQLGTPVSVFGGAYFTKMTNSSSDLYIQTPPCGTKNGVVKSGKRMFIDLLFDKTDENIVMWFENLEEKTREIIYTKRDMWFQESVDEDDIESAFSPSVRLYKSGTYYSMRVFLDNPRLYGGSKNITIYDDRENELTVDDITSDSKIICILQVHGIKFTSKSFQVYTQIKQAMVIKNNMFNRCCIKTSGGGRKEGMGEEVVVYEQSPVATLENIPNDVDDQSVVDEDNEQNISMVVVDTERLDPVDLVERTNDIEHNAPLPPPLPPPTPPAPPTPPTPLTPLTPPTHLVPESVVSDDGDIIDIGFEDLSPVVANGSDDSLKEFTLDVDVGSMESITLRNPDEVYYDIYKDARAKAKTARKAAIQSYIEAQNIRNTHHLEIANDSSDEEYERQIYEDGGIEGGAEDEGGEAGIGENM